MFLICLLCQDDGNSVMDIGSFQMQLNFKTGPLRNEYQRYSNEGYYCTEFFNDYHNSTRYANVIFVCTLCVIIV